MKTYKQLVTESLEHITEIMPWDLEVLINSDSPPLLIDIREPYEFSVLRIKDSINVPRGILESACDWDYEETVPLLALSRNRPVAILCRSGLRSALAAHTMQLMGFVDVISLKTGIKGWNDAELPLVDASHMLVDIDEADEYFASKLRPEQLSKNQ